MTTSTVPEAANDGRDETALEQLDRNTIELLNELRVAGTGIQAAAAVAGAVAGAALGFLWFALPLNRRRDGDPQSSLQPPRSG